MQHELAIAYALGVVGFQSDKLRIPQYDKALGSILDGYTAEAKLPVFAEWVRGWDETNVARQQRPDGAGSAMRAVERIYKQMLVDLRSLIEAESGSVRQFVLGQNERNAKNPEDITAHTFEIRNLYRVFSEDNTQRMSLNLYIKLCQALGIGGDRMRANRITPGSNETLVDYLSKDFDIVWRTALDIQYQGS